MNSIGSARKARDIMYLSLIPERKSIAMVRKARLIAAPKSGCMSITAWNRAITARGFINDAKLSVLKAGDERYRARKITMESFTNSEGWNVEGQRRIHLLAPFTWTPMPGRKTSSKRTNEKSRRGIAIFLRKEGLSVQAKNMKHSPMRMVNRCLLK